MTTLALQGGPPVGRRRWPLWPQSDEQLEAAVVQTLRSGRWTISGPYRGASSRESTFAALYAHWAGARFGVTTCNGTHALVTALEALDIGPGDEVIVPGLTWVADATAVINLNATPVLVDVDETLCLSPDAVEAAISPRTKAIIAVSLYSGMPDWDRLTQISRRHDIPLIEDAAQSHGAAWNGRPAGSLGLISAFSFQQSKLLTCGEGGIALTDNADLHARMSRIRCDGRDYFAPPTVGQLEIDETEVTPLMGSNYCLSDVAATILIDRLSHLDRELDVRLANAALLDQLLSEVPGLAPVPTLRAVTRRPIWRYAIRVDRTTFAGAELRHIAAAFLAETGLALDGADMPLNRNNLYRPVTKRRFLWPGRSFDDIDPSNFDLPNAWREYERLILIPHPGLLGTPDDMAAIRDAFFKIQRHADTLVAC